MRALIADHDPARFKGIADACIARGHLVERATQGAAALETALERIPDIVICPIDLAVIDGYRLSQILRGNPRTRATSFIFLINDELDAPMTMDSRDATVVSPWHPEDVLDHVHAILERSQRFGEMRTDTEIEGKLSQISIVDLLQIFQMNAKSGTLRIIQQGMRSAAIIMVLKGQVIDASIPLPDGATVVGEKALYRILAWTDGRFEFLPGDVTGSDRISKPTRVLLMEGMRQKDEWDKLARDMPSADTRLRLSVARSEIPSASHPLTREVIEAVESYGRVDEIVDHCGFPDYQVLRVLSDLLARSCLAVDSGSSDLDGTYDPAQQMLFTDVQVRRMKEWAAAQRPRGGPILKIPVASADQALVKGFVAALERYSNFVIDGRLKREPGRLGHLGPLGHLPLGEGLSIRFISIPADPAYAPLWNVAAYGMLGAIVLPAAAFGAVLEETEPVFAALSRRQPGAVAHLLIADGPGVALSDSAKRQLEHLEGGSFFVLPEGSPEERRTALRNAFARLVP